MEFPKHLKVAAVNVWPYYIFKDPKNISDISGIEGELLKVLAERLNFRYTVLLPTDGQQFGFKDASGTWTGVKGMVARGEVDLTVSHLGITEEVFKIAEMSAPYYADYKTFASDLPRPLPKYTVLIRPFSVYVWIAIVVCFTLIPFIFHCLTARRQRDFGNHSNEKEHDRPKKQKAPNTAMGILDGFLLVSDTLLRFIYTSVILSVLTVERKGNVIRTAEELAPLLKSRKYKCMLLKGNTIANFLMGSNLEYLRTIGSVIKNYNDPYVPAEYQMKPFGDKRVVVGSKTLFQIMHGPTKFISDDLMDVASTAVFLKKGFCCEDRFSTVLLRIVSAGLYEKFIRDVAFPQEVRISSSLVHTDAVTKLNMNALSGIFFVLCMGYISSLVLLLLEIAHDRWRRKPKIRKLKQ
ncbi:ionotropic receptor 21a-like [Argiope bruennichi]|uniref:ionotropic receptor 21a-like n=1 Tax=Argiope bruennichi TaxID=94029 RepID=UPI0024958D8A|nr:ionotropic receptor 21a-like [Argiope bruennichi]